MTREFICEVCNFKSSRSGNYKKHLSTRKHQILTNPNKKALQRFLFWNKFLECGTKFLTCHHFRTACLFRSSRYNCMPTGYLPGTYRVLSTKCAEVPGTGIWVGT